MFIANPLPHKYQQPSNSESASNKINIIQCTYVRAQKAVKHKAIIYRKTTGNNPQQHRKTTTTSQSTKPRKQTRDHPINRANGGSSRRKPNRSNEQRTGYNPSYIKIRP
jgi:hypothetical protein